MKKHFDLEDADALNVAVLSDTHGELAPEVADVVSRCDAVIHAGDICGAVVIEELERLCPVVIAVAGNNDVPELWAPGEEDVVATLPDVAVVHTPDGDIVVEHGHRFGHYPDHAEFRAAWPDARLVIYGHTHIQEIDCEDDPWVINPGAAGHVRNQGGPHCLLLTFSYDEWEIEPMRFLADADDRAA